MQKLYAHFKLLSFLFLTSGGIAQCMEGIELSPSVYESLSYYIPSLFTIPDPQFIHDLRINKNDFEQELQLSFFQLGFWLTEIDSLDPLKAVTAQTVMHLFRYCYYYQFYYSKSIKISLMTDDLFDASQHARINGYSVLGAAIIARDVPIDAKRDLIQRLMRKGFALTEKDKILVELELYDYSEDPLFLEKFDGEDKKTR
ncbi:MAG TPA: hypothetical protein VJ201_01525 [Candidatus Babeliales bacterium]|nr:hypothetical protein [Candidatus Babeliales bacterium]